MEAVYLATTTLHQPLRMEQQVTQTTLLHLLILIIILSI